MASRSRHVVSRCVDWASHSATELLQDSCQPLCPPTNPMSREPTVGLTQADLRPTLGPNPWLQLMIPNMPPSLSLKSLICTILGDSCHFLPTLKGPSYGPAFASL